MVKGGQMKLRLRKKDRNIARDRYGAVKVMGSPKAKWTRDGIGKKIARQR